MLSKPKIELVEFNAIDKVKRGESAVFSCNVLVKQSLKKNYRVFIHISFKRELNKRPSERRWYINADRDPWVSTSRWAQDHIFEIGPVSIFFPEDFPLGMYALQVGLFNPESRGSYYRLSSNYGAFDFRGSYPRLRYANPDIKDFIIGYIEVVE